MGRTRLDVCRALPPGFAIFCSLPCPQSLHRPPRTPTSPRNCFHKSSTWDRGKCKNYNPTSSILSVVATKTLERIDKTHKQTLKQWQESARSTVLPHCLLVENGNNPQSRHKLPPIAKVKTLSLSQLSSHPIAKPQHEQVKTQAYCNYMLSGLIIT